jgi:hypothetical protein
MGERGQVARHSLFAKLTVQMQDLKDYKKATLVATEPTVYIKTDRKLDRPKKREQIATRRT